MRILNRAAILLFAVAIAAQLGGCVHSGDSSVSKKGVDPMPGDSIGYYEIPYQGTVYVLGSIQSRDKLRNGQIPPTAAGGFSLQGQAVLFEMNNAGLSERLMGEYDRRHGLSSR